MTRYVQIDYDATVTLENVGMMLQKRFAKDLTLYNKLKEAYENETISIMEAATGGWANTEGKQWLQTEMLVEAFSVGFRPGLPSFLEFCKERELVPVVVSDGLSFYMKLPKGVPLIAGTAVFDGNSMQGYLPIDFKLNFARQFRPFILIGDGLADVEPSRYAALVFSVKGSRLNKESCTIPFETFFDIIEWLTVRVDLKAVK